MSDAPGSQQPTDGTPSPEELAHIQSEVDALQAQLDRIKTPKKRRLRRLAVGVLVALSCLFVLLSTTVVWAHRTVLNTTAFVNTVGPVFQNPEVTSAVSARATNQLFQELHLQSKLRNALPSKVSFVAVPITAATESYVSAELAKVLGSERFQTIWINTLTTTHAQVVAVLRGQKSQTLSTSNGYIVLNTVPVINHALGDVSGLASNLTGKNVTLPTITSAELPQQAVNKLSQALGVQLPSNFGQITLVRSNNLSTVQRGVKAFDRLTLALPLITLALIAFSLWLSVARRRTLIQLMVGIALLMIILRRVVIHEQGVLANSAHNPQVAQIVLGDLLNGFFVLTAWVLGVALAVLVVALVSGPYRWAVALRSLVARAWQRAVAAVSSERRARTAAWLGSHADGLQLGGAVLAGIVLLIVSVSWLSFLIVGGLLVLYEVFLQVLKTRSGDEASSVSATGSESDLSSPVGGSSQKSS